MDRPNDTIIVYALPEPDMETDEYERMRGGYGEEVRGWFRRAQPTPIAVNQLQQQLNVFLVQMDGVLKTVPREAGGFTLDEIEFSAGITTGGEIALFGFGGVSGEFNGGLRVVFKRQNSAS